MVLPLYTGASCPSSPAPDAHRGLLFERLFDRYVDGWEPTSGPQREAWAEARHDWIKRVAGTGLAGDDAALQRHADAVVELAEALGGEARAFDNDWHFATGLGLPHPVENGLSWHPTLGVPYLTGAAVKGLLRAWVEQWQELDDGVRRDRIDTWFGREGATPGEAAAGRYLFFEAVPMQPVRLLADVMTPHMGQWYESGDGIRDPDREPEKVPADWHDPVPIPFLVASQVRLLCGIAVRPGLPKAERDMAQNELGQVWDGLTQALDWLGAGAKTAAGYGHFQEDQGFTETRRKAREAAKQKQEKEKELMERTEGLSKDAVELWTQYSEGGWEQDNGRLLQGLETFFDTYEQPSQDALAAIEGWLEQAWKGIIANPDAVKGKKKKPKFKSQRAIDLAKRLNTLKDH